MSKPPADFISKINKWSFNSVKHIFPHIQGFLHTLLNSFWLASFILKRMPEQTQHSRKGLGVCLSPDIKNMGAYCWGYLRSQTPCLEIYSASSLSCPWEAALGPGQHETFIWTCMRNPGKRRRLQTKALGTGTRERTCFWGHFFLTSPDTVTCLGDSFLYAHCPDIKELQMRVRAPLCWTLQTQNLKLLPALWTTISFYFFATDSECS